MEEEKEGKKGSLLFNKRAEEFLNTFKKGAEFAQQLLKENERLRYRMAQLEEENKALRKMKGEEELEFLRKRVKELEMEKEELLKKYKEVERENIDFAKKYVEVEEENNNLANLYIASYQLHSTLDFNEVLQIITEILINLIGCGVFSIMLIDEKLNALIAVSAEGLNIKDIPPIKLNEGKIGEIILKKEKWIRDYYPEEEINIEEPFIIVPLEVKNTIIGAIFVYKLLPQKRKLEKIDYELFTMLAGHAATAIFSSKLYSDSERKLSTIQGFIQLLTKK